MDDSNKKKSNTIANLFAKQIKSKENLPPNTTTVAVTATTTAEAAITNSDSRIHSNIAINADGKQH